MGCFPKALEVVEIRMRYLHELTDGFVARHHIKNRLAFCNAERPHSTFNGATPDETFGLKKQKQGEKLVA